jgi:hypothetical protein
MTGTPGRDVRIEGTWNARAFGVGTPWLVRSAALDGLTDHGRAALTHLGVRGVVDLRERAESARPGHSLPIARVPIFALRGEPDPRADMAAMYHTLIDYHGERIAEAVTAIARVEGPALVHCAIGKDRTGLVVALTLLAAGYSRDVVVQDYSLSGPRQPSFLRRATTKRMATEGIEAQTPAGREYLRRNLDSPPEILDGVLDYLEFAGGWRTYLLGHGVSEVDLDALAARARFADPTLVRPVGAGVGMGVGGFTTPIGGISVVDRDRVPVFA